MVLHKIRDGSLQYWPRVRAKNILPSVNWKIIKKDGLQGFIGYKVGMTSIHAKDNTPDSMVKGKKIIMPGTIIECPSMKIYSIRLYKNNLPVNDLIVGFDDELKSVLKKPKKISKVEEIDKQDFDDLRVIVYSNVKNTGIKKSPEIAEIALGGTKEDKIKFVKEKTGKEITISEVFKDGLVDVRGVTKGYGTQGPVKRMGIGLKAYKSEKGQRRPGSLGPWHPARVTFRVPMMGQTGFFSRINYNNLIVKIGKISESNINNNYGFHRYGNIKTDYLILKGSVSGTKKRPLLITPTIRPTRKQSKQKYEFIELR